MPYNKLVIKLTSLARYAQRNIGSRSFSVQTSPCGLGLYKKYLGPIFLCTDLAFG